MSFFDIFVKEKSTPKMYSIIYSAIYILEENLRLFTKLPKAIRDKIAYYRWRSIMSKEYYDWIFVKGSRRRVENAFAKKNLKSWTKLLDATKSFPWQRGLDLDLTTEGFAGCRENCLSHPRLFLYERSTMSAISIPGSIRR